MTRLACALAAFAIVVPATARAHVLDQYLQVAQLAVARDGVRVELRLVPGVHVADRVLALVDTDGDGELTAAEQQAYARQVRHAVTLAVDDRPVALALVDAQFPSPQDVHAGVGVIRVRLAAPASLTTAGRHRIAWRNDYLPDIGVYLANVLVPKSDTLTIVRQARDPLQRGLTIDVDVRDAAHARWPLALLVALLSTLVLLVVGARLVTARKPASR